MTDSGYKKGARRCNSYPKQSKSNTPMVRSFSQIVKPILKSLPEHDYPVLSSRRFFEIWLTFILDQGLMSMRDLFFKLNHTGISVDISTFSKACKNRDNHRFCRIYTQLIRTLKQRHHPDAMMLIPIDSTVVTLTSRLFWQQSYHRVKLLAGFNQQQGWSSECLIHFGQGHDAKFSGYLPSMIPENGIGIMDRGFADWHFIDELSEIGTYFVVRIKNNMKVNLNHDRYRVVTFCDLESRCEFRLATNLVDFSNEEIGELYRKRWQIELLWKFLKMHLKLDQLITKNQNGVAIQIYMVLIAYAILQLIELPQFYSQTLLDKLRYLQVVLGRYGSISHWSYDLLPETLVA